MTLLAIYLTHNAALIVLMLTLLWAISVAVKNASLIDVFWGFGFLMVGAVSLWLFQSAHGQTPSYILLLCLLPITWGLRLTLYLGIRNIGHPEDQRYIALRKRSHRKSGISELGWRLRSLFTIYYGQGLLILVISAPIWVVVAKQHAAPSITEIKLISFCGLALWLIGFVFEAIGDFQLSRFMKLHKTYDGPIEDKPVLTTGLWAYTRHPNYFGNACMWWGIWLIACQAPLGWLTIFAPLIMTVLLIRISGKNMLEDMMEKRKPYQDYIKTTSGFLPKKPKR